MVRIAKPLDFKRIEELKKKINNDKYLEHAIDRIAQALSKGLVAKE